MLTLKQAYIELMKRILKNSTIVEDYYENMGENIKFSFEQINELQDDERIYADFLEMQKVFFTNKENIFGHSYGSTIATPYTEILSPVEAISELLNKNEGTRKAVLTFVPYGDEKIPCITSIQFLVRDHILSIFYTSRSQDIYRKFPCDAMCIASFGIDIAKQLGLKLGYIQANIISTHIYLRDKQAAEEYIKNND